MEFKPKILVVDDDPQILRLLGETLANMKAECRCMESGTRVTKLINRDKFDGIILARQMSGMGGLELAKLVRRSKANSRCIIFMVNRNISRTAVKQSLRIGVNYFLQMPVKMEHLRFLLNSSRDKMLWERRRCKRAPVAVSVLCQWKKHKTEGLSINLCASGVLVVLGETPPLHAQVSLEFSSPWDSRTFQLTGQVTRVGLSVGIKFTDLSKELEKSLVEFTEIALASVPKYLE